jgi:hypothetical protein
VDHLLPDHVGVELADGLVRARILQRVGRLRAHRLHELGRHGDGDVEVRHLREVFLAGDEVEDVRVVHAENPHVRAAPRSALLHRIGGGVVELHERDGSAGDARGRAHDAALLAQTREGEAGAAAGLMDERHRAQRVVDAVVPVRQRILDGKDEARRELAERTPRVHERRRIRLEAALGHEEVELLRRRLHRPLARAVAPVRFGDHRGHAPEEILRLLRRLA